jgi:chemotaxis regulatin CheY-phosphate phosphatase CheZ
MDDAPTQDQNFKREVVTLFERFQKFMDSELQQRAAEYLVSAVMEVMAEEETTAIYQQPCVTTADYIR